jgi:anti-sigma regulatory factor (Ser/Thr protein kinase)
MPTGKNGIIVELRDNGIAFDPLSRPEPDIGVPVERRPIGGLGIMLIKKTMDELKYKRENNQNIFTMTKYL